jgi:hypothetical protein
MQDGDAYLWLSPPFAEFSTPSEILCKIEGNTNQILAGSIFFHRLLLPAWGRKQRS